MTREERHRVINADCRDAMRAMDADSIDAIVTDPPYGWSFMGREWDHGVPGVEFWVEALRVAKPGAHLVAFGGARTFHRLTCAIEDAGWEIRDCLSWLYGSGFPKSLDVSKAIDKAAGAEREVIESRSAAVGFDTKKEGGGGWSAGVVSVTSPATDDARAWQGWGTALKPAWEPVIIARKPLGGTVASNVLAHGTGAINVDGCRIQHSEPAKKTARSSPRYSGVTMNAGVRGGAQPTIASADPSGRWPANVVLDEEAAAMLGEPSRFFYVAKATGDERGAGNTHPTVKPQALMRMLVRLVTPPSGLVLDPFCGSGSTLVAASLEGFSAVGIEREPEYAAIARGRIYDFNPMGL